MSDFFPSDRPASANLHEFSVSELAGSIKRTIENAYDRVRVRGELGRVTIAKSGHMYADLKDDKAVINTIMWKGSVGRLPFRPEEGLEVVAEGKLSTFPGRSNYQLIADTMNPAGAGALMALLEERKKKLAAEGLFAADRKKAIPFLPRTIGVVTSPTGAVIRDILHRIRDRFPVHVIVWPALVQGDKAAEQVTAGIRGFNALPEGHPSRPDLIIVARGGGSIEDLWPFNEEIVVRATADSVIPLISAVGHETDTTLIDYASDRRAPTPTGAAEIAVPVRTELMERLNGLDQRLIHGLTQWTKRQERDLTAIAARLPRAESLLDMRQQRFDYAEGRLGSALQTTLLRKEGAFEKIGPRLRPQALSMGLRQVEGQLTQTSSRLAKSLIRVTERNEQVLTGLGKRLEARTAKLQDTQQQDTALANLDTRLTHAFEQKISRKSESLQRSAAMLEALSYQATLKRGYAIVRTADGELVRTTQAATQAGDMVLTLSDGDIGVRTTGDAPSPPPAPTPKAKPAPKPASSSGKDGQGSLF